MDCMVCGTPLQLMNGINMATSLIQGGEVDLYILDHAEQNQQYFDALRNAGIFHSVYFLHSKQMTGGNNANPLVRYLKASWYLMRGKTLLQQIPSLPVYDRFFIPTPDVPSQLLYYAAKKKNPSVCLYMFEEGTFAYNYFEHEFGKVKKLFLRILFQSDIMHDYQGAYVYHPGLLNNVKNLPIYQLQPISKHNKVLVDFYLALSGYDPASHGRIKNEVLFFDQPFLFTEINQQQYELYDVIRSILPQDCLQVKLHPRTSNHPYEKVLPFQVSSEIMEMNESFEDKTLISVFSTACLSPKMLFDEEPVVVLLYKLVDLHLMTNINENTFQIAYQIRSMYRDQSKVKIPETLEDLKRILMEIKKDRSDV